MQELEVSASIKKAARVKSVCPASGKICYVSPQEAHQHMPRRGGKVRGMADTYRCEHCGHVHITGSRARSEANKRYQRKEQRR